MNLFSWFSRRKPDQIVISVWHNFVKPPWGGGNQFLLALCKALSSKGLEVKHNVLSRNVDIHLVNSKGFDGEKLIEYKKRRPLKAIHRIDGPMQMHRNKKEEDDLCFKYNHALANATVIQSEWSFKKLLELGYEAINPHIIHNASDPDIFNRKNKVPFARNRKARLISTSWSNNPNKGGHIYKWIDENLDTQRFEYTFVGNIAQEFKNIKVIPPVGSEELANILKQHDIYIMAGRLESCSNALIEALSCGLPALYLNDSSHPEVVKDGGVSFDVPEEIPTCLNELVENYEKYQSAISVMTMDEVSEKYLDIIKQVLNQG